MSDPYAVIGNPIAHSKSPMIHTAFAQQTGQDIEYTTIEGPAGGFAAAVDAFRSRGGRGLNITTPFKLDAFAYATRLLPAGQQAGAVNAMKFDEDVVLGENFDGVGLVTDIQRNLRVPLKGQRVLLLGAGGAARGALLPFLEQAPAELMLVNRTAATARALGEQFAGHGALITGGYDALAQAGGFDIVVNATSASLRAELPPLPPGVFAAGCLAYDMTYGKGLTPFLRLARDAGVADLADGVGMLVEQAAEAFAWWRGRRPDTRPVIEALTVRLT